jgi:hypothetical protein
MLPATPPPRGNRKDQRLLPRACSLSVSGPRHPHPFGIDHDRRQGAPDPLATIRPGHDRYRNHISAEMTPRTRVTHRRLGAAGRPIDWPKANGLMRQFWRQRRGWSKRWLVTPRRVFSRVSSRRRTARSRPPAWSPSAHPAGVRWQRWNMSPCPPVRGFRPFRPHMHLEM